MQMDMITIYTYFYVKKILQLLKDRADIFCSFFIAAIFLV